MCRFLPLLKRSLWKLRLKHYERREFDFLKQIGSSVSIVGALVIGQAAIQAGIVSPPMVMVVALTGIASFTVPAHNLGATLRLLRFPMMLLAGTLGLLGVMLGVLGILTHLCTLRTFGVPYLSPLAPLNYRS